MTTNPPRPPPPKEPPALVTPPLARNLEVARRVAFAVKAETLHESNRCAIPRLNVGLEAMQAQAPKRELQDRRQGLAHVALPRIRGTNVVAEIGASEAAADYLTDLDCAEECLIGAAYDEPAFALPAATATEQQTKRRVGARRRDQAGVEALALIVERDVLGGIAGARRAQVDSRRYFGGWPADAPFAPYMGSPPGFRPRPK